MTDSFRSVSLKTGRAKQHIDDLEAAIVAFHSTNPYTVVVEDNPQTGKRIAKIGKEPPPIPDAVPVILGDIVHAIRSSLDHFAYTAVANPTQDTAFPVCRREVPTAQHWKSLVANKLKGASKQLTQAVLALQPYEGGREDFVWLVDYLDLVDKHRLLVTTGVAFSAMTFDISAMARGSVDWAKDLPSMPISLRPADRYPVQNGTELFIGDPEGFEQHGDLKFSFDVAFGEPQALAGEPVVAALRHLLSQIESLLQALTPLV